MIMFGYKTLDLKQFDLKMDHGKYYFDDVLLGKTKDRTEEIHLKLELPTFLNQFRIESENDYLAWNPILYADSVFGKLRIKDNKYFVKK